LRDLRGQRAFLLHDLADIARGAQFFRNDDNIVDKLRRPGQPLQIDAAILVCGSERQKLGSSFFAAPDIADF
jgi:hypothetical protein